MDAAEDFVQRFRSAFELIEGDDRGRQIALFELTTWSLRSTEYRDVARSQYAAYRATAESVTGPWLAAHGVDLPTSPEIFAQFVAALFDGVNLAWLADPGRHRTRGDLRVRQHGAGPVRTGQPIAHTTAAPADPSRADHLRQRNRNSSLLSQQPQTAKVDQRGRKGTARGTGLISGGLDELIRVELLDHRVGEGRRRGGEVR